MVLLRGCNKTGAGCGGGANAVGIFVLGELGLSNLVCRKIPNNLSRVLLCVRAADKGRCSFGEAGMWANGASGRARFHEFGLRHRCWCYSSAVHRPGLRKADPFPFFRHVPSALPKLGGAN
jgi:hypothetical protein